MCYRGPVKKWQIWVQKSHYLTAIGYCGLDDVSNTKVWSVDHIIVVMFIIGCAIGGLQKSGKFGCSGHTF